ncbi:threonine/homoserine/homoserine lactone efflux protein [Luteibacter sp. Sphag1AF]|uniref:hypothetical protein n=1 Tax=Luteibacter sp. Sphag1AF TaxID=2587031 RepID=UPI001618E371|nr:hypothetical protein [Luteibacter sp. Sphag1AF]MBB3226083.1 threonine/homoserine/homoserine lactone efflux protein [Luteibacter sp. Sphag1AF]
MRFTFPSPRRSRNPLVRVLSLLAGLAVLGVLLVFGVVVLGVLAVGGAAFLIWRQWKLARLRAAGVIPPARANTTAAPHDSNVLEGEFVVIQQQGRPVHH